MELIWATPDFEIDGCCYSGFPIILWDTMETCRPANKFIQHYLIGDSVSAKNSWPTLGRVMYDYFSFLQVNSLSWKDVSSESTVNILASYRNYCIYQCKISNSTIRQRMYYLVKFYEYALKNKWITSLPFSYEKRRSIYGVNNNKKLYKEKLTARIVPHTIAALPKFLSLEDAKKLIAATKNPHHRMMIRMGLQLGMRREEIITFPLQYITEANPPDNRKNFKILLDPRDGSGIKTKGSRPREIYISRNFYDDLKRYTTQLRNVRANKHRGPMHSEPLFVTQSGTPFRNGGKGLDRIVRLAGVKAGIKVHTHMLRHTYATHTLAHLQHANDRIDPLIYIQKQLGHASITTTMVYLHLIDKPAEDAVLAYDDELSEYGVQHA